MKSFILCLVVCFSIVGCSTYTPEEVINRNTSTLSNEGEFVGTFKDGKKLRRFHIYNQGMHDHYVYIVDGVVSVNASVDNGKSNKVEVFINGVKQ